MIAEEILRKIVEGELEAALKRDDWIRLTLVGRWKVKSRRLPAKKMTEER